MSNQNRNNPSNNKSQPNRSNQQAAKPLNINEGMVKKGGVNTGPKSPRPAPPQAQLVKPASTSSSDSS